MSTIPQLRAEMSAYADRVFEAGLPDLAAQIWRWVDQLHRRSPVRRAKSSPHATPDFAEIARFADIYPEASYMEIAKYFGCSIGRVSEALAGFRE